MSLFICEEYEALRNTLSRVTTDSSKYSDFFKRVQTDAYLLAHHDRFKLGQSWYWEKSLDWNALIFCKILVKEKMIYLDEHGNRVLSNQLQALRMNCPIKKLTSPVDNSALAKRLLEISKSCIQ